MQTARIAPEINTRWWVRTADSEDHCVARALHVGGFSLQTVRTAVALAPVIFAPVGRHPVCATIGVGRRFA